MVRKNLGPLGQETAGSRRWNSGRSSFEKLETISGDVDHSGRMTDEPELMPPGRTLVGAIQKSAWRTCGVTGRSVCSDLHEAVFRPTSGWPTIQDLADSKQLIN
jgi:hypothetical protein